MRSRSLPALGIFVASGLILTGCVPEVLTPWPASPRFDAEDVQAAVDRYYDAVTWFVADPDAGIGAVEDAATAGWAATLVQRTVGTDPNPSVEYRLVGTVERVERNEGRLEALTCVVTQATFEDGDLKVSAPESVELHRISLVRHNDEPRLIVWDVGASEGPCD